MKKVYIYFLLISIISLPSFICKEEEGLPNEIDGTLKLPAAAPGKRYYVAIDNDQIIENGTIKEISGICGDTNIVKYTLKKPPKGFYYVYAGVDVIDNNKDFRIPDIGDYLLDTSCPHTITGGFSYSAMLGKYTGWEIKPLFAVCGEISGPKPPKEYTEKIYIELYIDNDINPGNGYIKHIDYDIVKNSIYPYYFEICELEPGTYTIYGHIDSDNSGLDTVNTGDYLGMYGEFTITNKNLTELDFKLNVIE